MDITELLTNPIVWGLLAWLFSRFFISNKKEEKAPEKQPNKRKNRSNPRPNPKPVRTTIEQQSRKEAKPAQQTVHHVYKNINSHTTSQLENAKIVKEQLQKKQHIRITEFPNVNRNIKQNTLKIDQQKAVQGVIWSEILGAPRSKKPHYTRNR